MHPPRITLLDERTQPDLAALAAAVRAARGGQFLNLYRALAHSPGICAGWLQLFTQIRQHARLAADLREIAILRVAVLNRADYEFAAHLPFARAAAVPEAVIAALRLDPLPGEGLEPRTRDVLAYVDAMTRAVQVEDAVFDRVKAHLSERTLVELTVTVAGYNMVSRVLEALAVPHEPEHPPAQARASVSSVISDGAPKRLGGPQ